MGTAEKKNERKNIFKVILKKKEVGILIPLAVLLLIVAFVNINFFSLNNILDILRSASFSLIIAVPLTFLLSCGSMDLSIGAVTSLGGIICGFALLEGYSIIVGILGALVCGAIVGFINGYIIVKHNMAPFITTLGIQYIVNGLIVIWTSGVAISGFPDSFKILGQSRLFGKIPFPILYAAVIAAIGYVLLEKSKFGRAVLATGGNRETAYLAGIPVDKVKIGVHIAVSTFASLAGVVMASRFATAQPAAGTGAELTIMASVIIGGTSTYGGVGTVIGSTLGCILLSTITNSLIVMGVSVYWQNFIFGSILIVSLFLDKYRRLATEGK